MIYDIFGEKYSGNSFLDFHYSETAKLIQHLRSMHLDAGGDPVDFPAYLEAAGIKTVGQLIVVEDGFETMAKLKYVRNT